MKILVIDNYDSFVYNLVQYIGELGGKPIVYRNDSILLEDIKTINPKGIIISPGPGHPKNKRDIGVCLELIKKYGKKIPLLGVCLGHQAIIYGFGGSIIEAENIMHGKTSCIEHLKNSIFKGTENPLEVMRYHSLIADPETFPHEKLSILANTVDKKEIFAVKHKKFPIYGLQFHPESVGTNNGKIILKNFLEICNDK